MSYRILGEGRSFYHCVSRVVDRRFVFGQEENRVFQKTMRLMERFTGVRVVTYCLMTNHFHLLLDVPDRATLKPLTLEELIELIPDLHEPAVADGVLQEIERAKSVEAFRKPSISSNAAPTGEPAPSPVETPFAGGSERASSFPVSDDSSADILEYESIDGVPNAPPGGSLASILARYERRRGDLSMFVRMLKQRITIYMNRRLEREGTLWESRFKSVLVEGSEEALMAVAAYIDLNPVRAGIVERPEDYAFSGYGEAHSANDSDSLAKSGLGDMLRGFLDRRGQGEPVAGAWRRLFQQYRLFLYETGIARGADPATGAGETPGVPPEEVADLHAQISSPLRENGIDGGTNDALARLALSTGKALRQRQIRYFIAGGILGSKKFIESAHERAIAAGRMPDRGSEVAHKLRGADWGDLRVFRNLQKDVIGE